MNKVFELNKQQSDNLVYSINFNPKPIHFFRLTKEIKIYSST